jgi:hypothetical protein
MRLSSRSRKKDAFKHRPEYLIWAKKDMRFLVCGYDRFPSWGHVNGICSTCGKAVTVPMLLDDVDPKFCIVCNPQLTEILREE